MHWPKHVYIPGQTERHQEDAFEAVCATAHASMSVEELGESAAFQHGLLYLDHGYYWEAHEVLEPVWMALDHDSEERLFVQALIQIANAHLKALMGRDKAARRLYVISRELLAATEAPEVMGAVRSNYFDMLAKLEMQINAI